MQLFQLILSLFFVLPVYAEKSDGVYMPEDRRQFFNSLSSLTMEVVDEASLYFDEGRSDFPWLAQVFHSKLLKYSPSGKGGRLAKGCDVKSIENNFFIPEDPAQSWAVPWRNDFRQCQAAWQTVWADPLSNILGMMSIQLNPIRYPFGRHVVFHLPQGLKVKGLLAMKADRKKRPLIILRSGIFSNSQEFYPERAYFIQLFEQSPFNVLLIESTSGTEFVKHNRGLRFGGFDEGVQNVLIAKLLLDPDEPISKYIDSIHLAGISLGGSGVFAALWLNEFNPDLKGEKLFSSAMNFCPLAQLAESLDFHLAQNFSIKTMNYWAAQRLHFLLDRYPNIRKSFFIQDFLGILNSQYEGPVFENEKLKVNLPEVVQKALLQPANKFWAVNNYWSLIPQSLQKPIQTPVAIFANENDPIVPLIINSQKLIDKKIGGEFDNLQVFKFSEGYHCSLPVAYDWNLMASLMQSFYQKFSPHFRMVEKEVKLDIPIDVWEKIQGKPVFLDTSFHVRTGSQQIEVKVRFDNDFWPTMKDKFLAPSARFNLPLSEMDFPVKSAVISDDEADLLSRWGAHNIDTTIEGSKLIFRWKIAE